MDIKAYKKVQKCALHSGHYLVLGNQSMPEDMSE